jgi:hypothetical protein
MGPLPSENRSKNCRWLAARNWGNDMPSLRRLVIAAAALGAAHVAAMSLFRSQRGRYAGDRRHVLVTQGGTHLRPSAREMDDAVISVLMGGAVVDLRHGTPDPRPLRIDVLVVMGGLELVVPSAWNVPSRRTSPWAGFGICGREWWTRSVPPTS